MADAGEGATRDDDDNESVEADTDGEDEDVDVDDVQRGADGREWRRRRTSRRSVCLVQCAKQP